MWGNKTLVQDRSEVNTKYYFVTQLYMSHRYIEF